ncbi:MAG: pyrroline-5-carboxylate reductase [Desulfobacterota bacterium]|nr:pyrroline-5-carboxylate reductase [Thermodesulfobacteriota bacterium]MDW8002091.1 pyrroline-5-carboxylate reductase [Deltaproteobacteria bacterium]
MVSFGIVGVGNMGEAIVGGLLEIGVKKENILFKEISDKRKEYVKEKYGIRECLSAEELLRHAKYILIAVKPFDAKGVFEDFLPYIKESHVIISVMAGVSISKILSYLGGSGKVIRVMPNLGVKVKEGVIGITRNDSVSFEEFEFVKGVFSGLGVVLEIKEDLFDALTAYSGSGPAFFLLFLEAMIDAGVKIGFTRNDAIMISEKVIEGTLRLMRTERVHPTILRERISSPAGTTIAGLFELEDRAFKASIVRAFEASFRRARELCA